MSDINVHDSPNGIDHRRVSEWLTTHVRGVLAPFTFDVIVGGHSNLTFCVTDSRGRRMVLRRPPLSHALASAHDMKREHRIITALRGSAVPVAPVLGICENPDVNGAPFYVMEFVEGHIVRDQQSAERLAKPEFRKRASESLVDTMVAIHAVDINQVGLQDLARHDGYIERQLKRWYGQWNAQKTRDLATIDRVHDELLKRIPQQGPATIVHGDYRLDNCIISDSGDIVAVLDWEICTLGDPLADLGLLMVYWTGPDDDAMVAAYQATKTIGFLNRNDLVGRYAAVSGRDVSHLDFYIAFALWKYACIIEGVYARYLGGALGDRNPAELEPFKLQVDGAATHAETLLARLH
jgi:aminoglycoside phosphotransferase (APT) family kinase protein